jgi:transketolase N-terminal domain/subunit
MFDTAGDGFCGLVCSENRVLTPEVSLLTHVVVGEGLYVALGVAFAPRHVRSELATALPLGDGFLKQLALLTIH